MQKLVLKSSDNGIPEAVADVISTPQTKIRIRPQHPHWRSVKESIQYIAACYAILFCLVAFCPGYLGQTITGWLNQSIKDADPIVLDIGKAQHPSMPWYPGMTRLFHINWTDSTHGTYENDALTLSNPPSTTSIIAADGTYASHIQHQLTDISGKRVADVEREQAHARWQLFGSFGNVLFNVPAWISNLNDATKQKALFNSVVSAYDQYRQVYPRNVTPTDVSSVYALEPTRWYHIPRHIPLTNLERSHSHSSAAILESLKPYCVPQHAPVTDSEWYHSPPELQILKPYHVSQHAPMTDSEWYKSPPHYYGTISRSIDPQPKTYFVGTPGIPVQFDRDSPRRWNMPYLVGKDLSNSIHWNLDLNNHFNLRIFLASVIAAFGTAPFAIMTCAFLPLRRPDELFVSEQGILQPNRFIGAPLSLWKDLHKVSLLNAKSTNRSRHVLKFVFRPGGTIKIRLNTISTEHLREILALADEYSINCQFDNKVIDLRRELLNENLSSLASANKFESTIFRPLIAGDALNGGKLRIIRKLASKPLSTVYLARNEQSKLVIVKQFVTPNDDAISAKYKSMFQREHDLIAALSHPMMAKLIDSFDENGATFLVIEHIIGENLRSIVERHGARSERIVGNWANQICQFMQYLHSQSPVVLHRDLTPDNIMLTDSGEIRIIDFGAAHQFMEGVTGTLIGKQCYIAPEQLRGKANIQSDIYSFGCTLYFLLSGKDPKALSQSDLADINIGASVVMQDLVKRCTEFDDVKRPKSFSEVAAIIQPVTTNKSNVDSFSPSKLLARFNAICADFPGKIRELMS